MKIYVVISKFYDTGDVEAFMDEIEADTLPKNKVDYTPTCDTYYDHFTDKKRAVMMIDSVKEA